MTDSKFTKFAAFDLEIAKPIPQNAGSWDQFFPLGITCAAVALEGKEEPLIWQGAPQMTPEEVGSMLETLQQLALDGYTLITWNGCKFDFRVVGEESGRWAEAAALAADHIDLMMMFTFKQGHYLGLDKALRGAGIQGKRKTVILNNGESFDNMDGAQAPHLWLKGEYNAVLSYLRDDVLQPVKLARSIEQARAVRWASSTGSTKSAPFDKLYTVRQAFELPQPDTSWMRNPPQRQDFIAWMPGGKLP